MSIPYLWKTKFSKISKFLPRSSRFIGIFRGLLIFILITAWLFSGFPRIWQNPPIPPETQEAYAVTERKSPDALLTQTNLSGTVANIQDDPDFPDANWLTAIDKGLNTVTRVSFPTPTGNPTVGANLQEFKIWVRRASVGTAKTPTVRIELYENNVSKAIILANTTVTNDTGILHSGFWDASLLGTADGSLVECYIYGTASVAGVNKSTIEVGTVEWNVDYTPSLATTFLVGGTEAGTKDIAVSDIIFPQDEPGNTITAPYNNVDESTDPQVLGVSGSEPVVKIKNTHASITYNVILEITTWTNSVVNMEYYNLATDGATNIETVTAELSNANGAARTVSTLVSISAGTYKDLYLKLILGSVFGKTGTSTLSVLGEEL